MIIKLTKEARDYIAIVLADHVKQLGVWIKVFDANTPNGKEQLLKIKVKMDLIKKIVDALEQAVEEE